MLENGRLDKPVAETGLDLHHFGALHADIGEVVSFAYDVAVFVVADGFHVGIEIHKSHVEAYIDKESFDDVESGTHCKAEGELGFVNLFFVAFDRFLVVIVEIVAQVEVQLRTTGDVELVQNDTAHQPH